jgi:hypothetical protein
MKMQIWGVVFTLAYFTHTHTHTQTHTHTHTGREGQGDALPVHFAFSRPIM